MINKKTYYGSVKCECGEKFTYDKEDRLENRVFLTTFHCYGTMYYVNCPKCGRKNYVNEFKTPFVEIKK
jgi:hypothetical protein